MSSVDLKMIRASVERYFDKWVANGGQITFYKCNGCNCLQKTAQPRKDQVQSKGYWDSATLCIGCGHMNFVSIYPSGLTRSWSLEKEDNVISEYRKDE